MGRANFFLPVGATAVIPEEGLAFPVLWSHIELLGHHYRWSPNEVRRLGYPERMFYVHRVIRRDEAAKARIAAPGRK